MTFVVLAAAPMLVALVLWAITDLSNFVIFGALASIALPASLARPGGTNIDAADLLLVLALVSWLVNSSLRNAPPLRLRDNPVIGAALAYWALNVLSLLWSTDRRHTAVFSIQLAELTLVYPVVMSMLPRSVRQIRSGVGLFVIVTTVLSLVTIGAFLAHPSAAGTGTYLPGLNKNSLGSFTVAGAIFAFSTWIRADKSRVKTLLAWATVLGLGATVASGSRGAMLGGAVGILFVTTTTRRSRFSTALVSTMIVAAIVVAYFAILAPAKQHAQLQPGAYNSASLRLLTWGDAISKIAAQPWIGTGARTYSDTVEHGVIPDPNNLFLLTWAELGIAGMVVLGFLLWRIGWLIARTRRLDGDAAAPAIGAAAIVLSLLTHFQFDISWVRGETTLEFAMVGLIMALLRLSTESMRTPRSGASSSQRGRDLIPA